MRETLFPRQASDVKGTPMTKSAGGDENEHLTRHQPVRHFGLIELLIGGLSTRTAESAGNAV